MIGPIHLKHPSKKLVFLIHGYTGSPTDFNGLPEYLYKKHKVDVRIVLLKGHGTRVEDLDGLEYNDFLFQVEEDFEENTKGYNKIVLGGFSFGGQLALDLASKYSAKGVFTVCLPYRLKFPFNVPGAESVGYIKKYWPKFLSKKERKLRSDTFYYRKAHIKGLTVVKQANRELDKTLPEIKCPVLTIHSKKDPVAHYGSIRYLEEKVKGPHQIKIFHSRNHNIFFSDVRFSMYQEIGTFVEMV